MKINDSLSLAVAVANVKLALVKLSRERRALTEKTPAARIADRFYFPRAVAKARALKLS